MLYNIKELRNYIMILQNITIILFQTKVNIKQIQARQSRSNYKSNLTNY